MFCHKCGTQIAEGADFCHKCGAKLIIDIPVEQQAESPHTNTAKQSISVSMNASGKKKSKKLPVILGIAILVVVLLIVLANVGGNEQPSSSNSGKVNLSQSYINEAEGISFNYPSAWIPVKEENYGDYVYLDGSEYLVILVNETDDFPEETSIILIWKSPATQDDADMISMSDDDFIEIVEDSGVLIKSTSTLGNR